MSKLPFGRVLLRTVKKSELLRALQTEIQKHDLSTFMSAEHKIVQTGCSACQKHFGTAEQFKRHITEDVLPPLLDKLSSELRVMPS
jgi:hypothetical protein